MDYKIIDKTMLWKIKNIKTIHVVAIQPYKKVLVASEAFVFLYKLVRYKVRRTILYRRMKDRKGCCNYWETAKMIFWFLTHVHYFTLPGKREYGISEFLLYISLKNKTYTMWKIINLNILKSLYVHYNERKIYDGGLYSH